MPNSGARTTDTITAAILSGVWRPGDRLQPHKLAEQYKVSTTVIREALSRMAGDGLVVMQPNRGFFIPELNLTELRDITELRCVTEALAVRLSIERGGLEWESELIATHHTLARTARRTASGEMNADWLVAHRAFHAKLLEASNCAPMLHLADNLGASTELYRRWAAPSTAATTRDVEAEHQAILEAAVARDPELTASRLRAHYEASVAVVLESGLLQDCTPTPPRN